MNAVADRQAAITGGSGASHGGSGQSVALAYSGSTVSAEARRATDAFASLDSNSAYGTDSREGWNLWAQAFGRWGTVEDTGGNAGSTSRSGGFVLGADKMLAPDLIAGAAFGFARTTTHSGGTTGISDTYAGALYASWTPGRAVFDLRAAIGPSDMRTRREIMLMPGSTITGNTQGMGGSVGIEAGYKFDLSLGITAKPFAGLTWQGLRRDGYSESLMPFGLQYPAQSYDKLTTTLGATLTSQQRIGIATLMPELTLAWAHDLRDTTMTSEAALLDSAFTINGARPSRDAAIVGFKLSGWTQDNFRLFAGYHGELRANATSHQISGGMRYTW